MNQQSGNLPANFNSFPSLLSLVRDFRLWGIVAGQFFLNIFFLAQRTLWLDEAYSALLARRTLPDIHRALRYDAGPPLYYDLLHGWCALFGESPLALRGLSLLFALLATVAIYWLAAGFWNRKTAFFSSLFFAFSPLTIAYIGEARNYTLLAFLGAVFALFLLQFLHHGGRKSLFTIGLVSLLLIYTHNVGWFLIAAGLIAALFLHRDWQRFAQLAAGILGAVVLYIPWLPVLFAQMQDTSRTIAWVENFWSPYALLATFSAFTPGGATPVYLRLPSFPAALQGLNLLLWIILLGLGILTAIRKRERKIGLVLLLFVLGLLGPYLYSLLKTPIYLAGRTDYVFFPLWCVIAGYGLSRLPWPWVRFALVFLLFIQAAWIDAQLLLRDDPLSERDAILYLQQHAQAGDAVLCTGLTRPPLQYALAHDDLQFFSYPRDMENHLAHLNEAWYRRNENLPLEAEAALRAALQSLPTGGTLWVVGSHRPINQPLLDFIQHQQWLTVSADISTPRMGLRKLDEPIFLWRIQP